MQDYFQQRLLNKDLPTLTKSQRGKGEQSLMFVESRWM